MSVQRKPEEDQRSYQPQKRRLTWEALCMTSRDLHLSKLGVCRSTFSQLCPAFSGWPGLALLSYPYSVIRGREAQSENYFLKLSRPGCLWPSQYIQSWHCLFRVRPQSKLCDCGFLHFSRRMGDLALVALKQHYKCRHRLFGGGYFCPSGGCLL